MCLRRSFFAEETNEFNDKRLLIKWKENDTENSRISFLQTHTCSHPARFGMRRTYGTLEVPSSQPSRTILPHQTHLQGDDEEGKEKEYSASCAREAGAVYLSAYSTISSSSSCSLCIAWECTAPFANRALQRSPERKFFRKDEQQPGERSLWKFRKWQEVIICGQWGNFKISSIGRKGENLKTRNVESYSKAILKCIRKISELKQLTPDHQKLCLVY